MDINLPIPEFLNEDSDMVHERMIEKAPPDVNTIEGDFFWTATRPVAEEIATLEQLSLQHILKVPFVQTSYGEYLDLIGEARGVYRKQALKSTGIVKVVGKLGTIIEKGSLVSTLATEIQDGIEFELLETKTIDETGVTYISAECTQAGSIGNVSKGSIVILATPINGVESIENDLRFIGGTDTEDDEEYRKRIILRSQLVSTSGNIGHYKEWTLEVAGVGDAIIIPTWNGGGTVKVIVLDANKRTPSESILNNVYEHIEAVRPIGATVTVVGAEEIPININVTVQLATGSTIEEVAADVKKGAEDYLKSLAFKDILVRYTKIASILLDIPNIIDYFDLTVNLHMANIEIPEGSVPVLGEVVINVT